MKARSTQDRAKYSGEPRADGTHAGAVVRVVDLSQAGYLDSAGFAVLNRLLAKPALAIVVAPGSAQRTAAHLMGRIPLHVETGFLEGPDGFDVWFRIRPARGREHVLGHQLGKLLEVPRQRRQLRGLPGRR